jgi:hypothetical protein
MGARRSDEAAPSLPDAATRSAWRSEARLFQLAIWVLEEDGGVMSAGDFEAIPIVLFSCAVDIQRMKWQPSTWERVCAGKDFTGVGHADQYLTKRHHSVIPADYILRLWFPRNWTLGFPTWGNPWKGNLQFVKEADNVPH